MIELCKDSTLHPRFQGSDNLVGTGGSEGKAPACNAGDPDSIPGSGSSPGEGNGNPIQYSCLENPLDGRAWWATVHGVAKSQTRLSELTPLHFYPDEPPFLDDQGLLLIVPEYP